MKGLDEFDGMSYAGNAIPSTFGVSGDAEALVSFGGGRYSGNVTSKPLAFSPLP